MIIVINKDGRVHPEDEQIVLNELAKLDPDHKLLVPVCIVVDYRSFIVKWSATDTPSTQNKLIGVRIGDGKCIKCGRLEGDHMYRPQPGNCIFLDR